MLGNARKVRNISVRDIRIVRIIKGLIMRCLILKIFNTKKIKF